MQVGQAITDYVRFLADARDAVYRLNNDQATAKQLRIRPASWRMKKRGKSGSLRLPGRLWLTQ